MLCACGSKQDYQLCCAPFLNAQAAPASAEQLMRSRYVAYSQANIDYILATMKGRALIDFNPALTKEWALSVKWLKLSVIATKVLDCPNLALVEFIAYYRSNNKKNQLHEISEFSCENGQWLYLGHFQTDK